MPAIERPVSERLARLKEELDKLSSNNKILLTWRWNHCTHHSNWVVTLSNKVLSIQFCRIGYSAYEMNAEKWKRLSKIEKWKPLIYITFVKRHESCIGSVDVSSRFLVIAFIISHACDWCTFPMHACHTFRQVVGFLIGKGRWMAIVGAARWGQCWWLHASSHKSLRFMLHVRRTNAPHSSRVACYFCSCWLCLQVQGFLRTTDQHTPMHTHLSV